MMRPNTPPPEQMLPAERRAELCGLLALGLIRVRLRDAAQLSAGNGEFPLHNSPDQSGTAETLNRRTA
jgi:hypothetical protein